jgi:DNA polymerase III delta subunit
VITTFTGENSFTLGEAVKQLIDSFVAQHGDLTLERLDGEEADLARIQQALTSLPFLATQQLVVLRTPSKNKQFVEQFEQLLSIAPSTTDVIIIEPKLDKRLNYYKFLKKKTDFREFPELDHNALASWLTSFAKEREGSLSPGDARYLVDRVGINQQLLAHELDKLLLYDAQISRKSIDALTDPVPQSTIFQLLEEAFSGHTKETLNLYAQQRALKVEPQQIIAMLAWQLHVVALIKTAGDRSADNIAQEAHMNPYVVRKSQTIARRLSLIDLKKRVADLTTIDKRLKRTLLDPDEALQHYLLSLKT